MTRGDWLVCLGVFPTVIVGAVVGLATLAQAELPKLELTTTKAVEPSRLDGTPRTPLTPPTATAHVGGHGGVMVADAHGLLVLERAAGKLIRADREGQPIAALSLSPGLGEIVHDGDGGVFVADRGAGRVVRIAPGDATGAGLAEVASTALSEPYGLALTPDGGTLLVTNVATHELVALASSDLSVRWRIELEPEPRGVAVSRDGTTVAVGFLSSSALALVELGDSGASPRVRWRSLDPRDRVEITEEPDEWGDSMVTVARLAERRSKYRIPSETGRRYARNFYALAFVGHDTLIAPHELATPQLKRVPDLDREDTYGGGAESIPPLVHQLGMVQRATGLDAHARFLALDVHQPKAIAYDLARDTLYVAGYGDDRIAAIAHVTQQMPYVDWVAQVGDGSSCGIDGLALAPADAGHESAGVWVHCEFRRQLLRLDPGDPVDQRDDAWLHGAELTPSARSPEIERGAELFRRGGDPRISADGMMACNSCHPEGRTDGLTWRLGDSILQTPILAGRVGETAPYKWDGQDPTLQRSLRHTMERLGATGLPAVFGAWDEPNQMLTDADVDAMIAYLESLPPPRPRPPLDADAVTRGRAVFEAEDCDGCHAGPKLVDLAQHDLETTMPAVDTPSLLGLSHSRPYYHDGSAEDLWTLLTDRGTIHAMADTSDLSDAQLRDLAAYLGSL